MAATVSAWAKPGAWALDSEENESELLQQSKKDTAAVNVLIDGEDTANYPSLAAATATKSKKKKPQALSLQEFSAYGTAKPAASQSKGLTSEELLLLPTGPRERSAEELDRSKLGGGFRSYGAGLRDDQNRHQGGFNRESNREFTPSRADDNADWGAGKKQLGNNGFERRERGGFFTDSQSRADDVDNWNSKKSYVPSEPRKHERRVGFGMDSTNGGSDSSNWARRKEEEGGRVGGSFDSLRDRRAGSELNGSDSEDWGRKREDNGGVGGGRPRLNLQPRTLPVGGDKKNDVETVVKPKGSNPFGDARPREEVLKEKGQDWKKIEEKLESSKTKEITAVVSGEGSLSERKNFWSGKEKLQPEDKTDKAWRKFESVDSGSQGTENSANGHAEEAEHRDASM